jgi:hypothetical protein
LVKVAVIEYEEILVLITETLDGMGDALGEVPDIAKAELLVYITTILVDSGYEHLAAVYKAPFGL